MNPFPRRQALLFLLSLGLGLGLTGCATVHPSQVDPAQRLASLMIERLSWMGEVAAYKQARHLPLEDPKREAELLAAMQKKGQAAGLPAKAVRAFFVGQMEAAKQRQHEYFKLKILPLSGGGALPDLAKVVRPALDQIGDQMIAALAEARAQKIGSDAMVKPARQRMRKERLSEKVMQHALLGLAEGMR